MAERAASRYARSPWLMSGKRWKGVDVAIDVDPINILYAGCELRRSPTGTVRLCDLHQSAIEIGGDGPEMRLDGIAEAAGI
jgi:hypothetical protein